MKHRLKRIARRFRDALPFATDASLKARIEQLERDLDEQRRYGLRVAEMLDVLEAKLSPRDGEQPGNAADDDRTPTGEQ